MKVICDGLDLSIATSQVIKAISNRTTNPVLEGIKLEAKGEFLKLSATDLELAIEKEIRGDIKEEGVTVVPGRFFSEFIKKLTNEKIELELNEKNKLKISYTDSETYLQCYNPNEFPNLNIIEDKEFFLITKTNFKNLISKSVFATALDDTRPVLKGCFIELSGDNISSVGLDGYRMAIARKKLEQETTQNTSFIVPAKSLIEINKSIEDSDDVIKVCFQRNFLMVESDGARIITRLIDGDFINYKQILPNSYSTTVIVSKNSFEEAIDRTSVLSRADKNNLVKFDFKDNLLTLSSNSDIGNIKENIGVSLSGNDLSIAFNARYFTECLRAVSDEAINLCFNMPSSPCLITPSSGDEFTFLILPVRIVNTN